MTYEAFCSDLQSTRAATLAAVSDMYLYYGQLQL